MTIIENNDTTTSIIIEDNECIKILRNEKDKYVLCIKRKDDMLQHVESIRSKPRKTKGVSK